MTNGTINTDPRLFNGCEVGGYRNRDGWLPACDWPADSQIQFGQDLSGKFSFFEVFMEHPDPRFHRGEGPTVADAERNAWARLERWRACNHEWVRRDGGAAGSTDTCGRCTKCRGVQTSMYPPMTTCRVCGVATSDHTDRNDAYLCAVHGHWSVLPRELWREHHWRQQMRDLGRRRISDMHGLEEEVWAAQSIFCPPPADIPRELDLVMARYRSRS